ncbi:MAG: CBS domain-containing protein [Burkholderiales bacterium]
MTSVSKIMTTDVQTIGPQETLQRAAQLMDRLNVGSLPVCSGRRLLGIVTDRDITVRATATGMSPQVACVSDVMSKQPIWCLESQDTSDVLSRMGEEQVRRMPVLDVDGDIVGIVSLGDLATRQSADTERALRDISLPSALDGGPQNA